MYILLYIAMYVCTCREHIIGEIPSTFVHPLFLSCRKEERRKKKNKNKNKLRRKNQPTPTSTACPAAHHHLPSSGS